MQRINQVKKFNYVSVVSLICIILLTLSHSIVINNSTWSIFGIIGGLMQTIGALGFPLAIMVISYNIEKNDNIYIFYKKVIKAFIIPSIVYFIICKLLSGGNYYSLWFTGTLIGILICIPFINILLVNMSDSLLKKLVALIIISRFIQIYLPILGININIDFNIFNNWIVFYVIGYSLTKIVSEKMKQNIYKIGIISFIVTFLLRGINIDFGIFAISPTIILYSSAVFIKMIDFKYDKIEQYKRVNKYIKFINEHKIGIYLMHNYIIINLLQEKFNLHSNRFKVIIGSVLVLTITFILTGILSLLIDKYIIPIVNKAIKYIVKKIKNMHIKQKVKNNKQYIIWIVFSIIISLFVEAISRGSIELAIDFSVSQTKRFFMNFLIVLIATSPCLLFKRFYFVFTIISELLVTLAIVSFVISNFRGVPLSYSDLYSIKDGIAVASQYINIGMIIVLVLILIILILIASKIFKYKVDSTGRMKRKSIILICILAILINLSIKIAIDKEILIPNQWDLKLSYDDNGFIYSLYNSYDSYKQKKPDKYNKKNIDKIKEKLFATEEDYQNEEKPNIIVVQLESVMDPMRILDIALSEDPIKNIRNAIETYSSGRLSVPTFGGGTARTEFEVLTGMNLDYLSQGEIPHSSILKKQSVESLAYILSDEEYEDTLIHNYEGSFYERNKVYENLGFKRYIPIEYMYNIEYPYSWPSDKLILQNIKDTLENTKKKDFIFALAVQTHGGYSHEYINEESKVKVSGELLEGQINQIQDYVDDLVMVDEFIGQLIDYVENLEEPTILAVYSDHLPSLDAVNDQIKGEEKYTTEYFIYDNIGLDKDKYDIESYELSTKILDIANISGGVMNKFHRMYSSHSDYDKNLELIQYDMLSGNNYILGGENIYKRTNLDLGLKNIIIENIEIEDNEIRVIGKWFNKSSCIYVNGKPIETEYKSDKELIGIISDKEIKEVVVHQISRYSKSIGKTKAYTIENQ